MLTPLSSQRCDPDPNQLLHRKLQKSIRLSHSYFVRLGISIHESNTMTRFDMYQQVRKINPQLYWHPDTQEQMKQDARRMGDAFFKQIEMHFGEVQP